MTNNEIVVYIHAANEIANAEKKAADRLRKKR